MNQKEKSEKYLKEIKGVAIMFLIMASIQLIVYIFTAESQFLFEFLWFGVFAFLLKRYNSILAATLLLLSSLLVVVFISKDISSNLILSIALVAMGIIGVRSTVGLKRLNYIPEKGSVE